MYACVRACVCECSCLPRPEKDVQIPLEPGLQVVVSCPTWVLGTLKNMTPGLQRTVFFFFLLTLTKHVLYLSIQ